MSFHAGDIVGDYRILRELGRGGEGRVFEVEHTITRRREAMKTLAAGWLANEQMAERFLREIRVQASLNHPNIAAVHNAFRAGEVMVMVMELASGDSLAQLLARGRSRTWRQAVDLVRQVLQALEHAHAHGVIHRDVSPANILISEGGRVKLTDFGLAWAVADLRLTQSGSFLGSAHYMAPEQIRGADKAGAPADLYSCGVVLYELVTGRKPFDADNVFDLMQAHVGQTPAEPRSINPDIPPALNEAILRALAKRPERRFGSAAEFRLALECALAQPVGGGRVKRSWAVGLAAGLLLAGLASLGSVRLGPVPAEIALPVLPAPPPPPEIVKPPAPVIEEAPKPVVRPRPMATARARIIPVEPKVFPPEAVVQPEATPALPEAPEAEPVVAVTDYEEPPQIESDEPPQKRGLLRRTLGKVLVLNPFRRRNGTEKNLREIPEPEH